MKRDVHTAKLLGYGRMRADVYEVKTTTASQKRVLWQMNRKRVWWNDADPKVKLMLARKRCG